MVYLILKKQFDKSKFLRKQKQFLEYFISADGIESNPDKFQCIKNFPFPKNAKQIKRFPELTGYYGKCIPNYPLIFYDLIIKLGD